MFLPPWIRIVVPRACCHALASVTLLCGAMPLWAQTPLTLQLKWSHGFQFAGYYVAKEKGFYREAGFDVKLVEGRPGLNVVSEVTSGRADFGVGTSGLLIARHAGEPVVVLAAIFQHSPLVLIARQDAYLQSIHDLAGRRVMIEPGAEELLAYLRRERIPLKSLNRVEHSFAPDDLIVGKVDAISAYSSNEPYALDKAGMSYHVFTPRSAGIDFYGDNLFTSESRLKGSPELVKAFREASLRGWRYATDHPEEVAALIHARYSAAQPLDFYLFEARRTVQLVRADLVEIGYMSPGRWQHAVDTYADMGMLPRDFDFRGFMYSEGGAIDSEGLRLYLAVALGGLALVLAVATYIHRINRQLHRSVAEARHAAGELQASEEKYRFLTETMKDVVWTADADSLRFTYISPSIERLRGYSVAEMLGGTLESTVAPGERNTLRSIVRQRSRVFRADPEGPSCFYTDVFEQPCKDGGSVWTEVVTTYGIHPRSGALEVHGVTRDITERRASQERIAHMAEHDLLTDLPNRALVTDRLRQALATARRNRHGVALLYIDLDRFKPVNDTYGHAVGDLLLKEAAGRMRACVRESDTVGRFGGDEFVVLLPVVELSEDALRVAEKIRVALAEPFLLAGLCLDVSSSIGVALYPEDGRDEETLLLSADRIMYEAKRKGRDQVAASGFG